MLKGKYKKLLGIKKPVLIEAKGLAYRYRILYPCGKCEYIVINHLNKPTSEFKISCFVENSLAKTLKAMQDYDHGTRKITGIKEL